MGKIRTGNNNRKRIERRTNGGKAWHDRHWRKYGREPHGYQWHRERQELRSKIRREIRRKNVRKSYEDSFAALMLYGERPPWPDGLEPVVVSNPTSSSDDFARRFIQSVADAAGVSYEDVAHYLRD